MSNETRAKFEAQKAEAEAAKNGDATETKTEAPAADVKPPRKPRAAKKS